MADEKQIEDGKRLSIAKVYIKDLSFESPMSPDVFKPDSWSPQTNLNLRSKDARQAFGRHAREENQA